MSSIEASPTGRIVLRDPEFQVIGADGKEVRLFEEEPKIIDADFAEIERRLVAHIFTEAGLTEETLRRFSEQRFEMKSLRSGKMEAMRAASIGKTEAILHEARDPIGILAREMWDEGVLGRMVRPYKPRQQPKKQDHARAKVKAARAQRRRQGK